MSGVPYVAPEGFYRTFAERIQGEVAARARHDGCCLQCLRQNFLPADISRDGHCWECRGLSGPEGAR